jgi:hypothetical protein
MSAGEEESAAVVVLLVGSWASGCCVVAEAGAGAEVGAPEVETEGEAEVAATGSEVVVVKILTGSGVELTRVKWLVLLAFWAPAGGPLVVVGEWLRDRVRLEPCRLGDVLPLAPGLPAPEPVPLPFAPL